MRPQSRRMSLTESLANVVIGYGVACVTQIIVFPWFGLNVPLNSTLAIGGIFTVVSIARSYVLRRGFEWLRVNQPSTRRGNKPVPAKAAKGGYSA